MCQPHKNMQIYFKEIKEWHNWLKKNHKSQDVIWLIYYKKHTKQPSLDYAESVEEGLCFGWIDSLVKRIDDERFMRKFTPRRKGSVWSPSNLNRIKKLIKEGRMQAAGLKTIEGIDLDGKGHESPGKKVALGEIPDFIFKSLEKHQKALRNFQQMAPSHKKEYIGWVMNAKREETRNNRLAEMINLLSKGQTLGLK